MRLPYFSFLFVFTTIMSVDALSQKIIYSDVDYDDTRRMTFEVMGKVSGNFLVYKNNRNRSYVSVYDNNMKQVNREEHDYISDRTFNIDFFPYADFAYMIYQYQKKNVVYCDAVRVDGEGKRIGEVQTLDTTHIGFAANNRVYSVISSEDKSKIMVYKINSKNKRNFLMTTVLFDDKLNQLARSTFNVSMEEYRDYLDEFKVDNQGDFVFTRFNRAANETINKTDIFWKRAAVDTVQIIPLSQENIYLDQPHIKVDNYNDRYFLTSFYYNKKRGNIEGMYMYVWDKKTATPLLEKKLELSEEVRREAQGNNSNVKAAFNDYFIRNIVIKRDGGFLVNTENYYTSSRFNTWNRFNYLYGSPYTYWDYYSPYSPYYSSWYWRNRNGQNVRHHAENISIFSFDKDGNVQWNSVIHKEQFDDQSDDRISYLTMNTGSQIHYLFNVDEKRALLMNDFTLSPDGQINHNPTLKNLDRGYEFLPKYGKQVSSNQAIIPCYYRNLICFAKIEFNQ